MRAFLGMIITICTLCTWPAYAWRSSYHNANPVGWMHLLPVGEMPGWSGDAWTNLEINHANIWNKQADFRDKRTDAIYTYKADFEQTSAIVEMGAPLSDFFAMAFEIPYANRNGGFLDDFIDQFHKFIGSDRFLRPQNPDYGNSFIVQKDGVNRLSSDSAQGVGNVKLKFKFWPWQWQSPTPGVCDCGFAISGQVKFPTQSRQFGLSSGNNDYSTLFHMGVPLGEFSAIWATAAYTRVGANETFAGWPRREWLQMYELSLDLANGPGYGLILQMRVESPLFMKEHLEYQYTYSTAEGQAAERISSAWHALTAWRGSESIGIRYRWGDGSQVNFLFVEDFALGHMDGAGQWLYVNNAPDVAFINQWHFVF